MRITRPCWGSGNWTCTDSRLRNSIIITILSLLRRRAWTTSFVTSSKRRNLQKTVILLPRKNPWRRRVIRSYCRWRSAWGQWERFWQITKLWVKLRRKCWKIWVITQSIIRSISLDSFCLWSTLQMEFTENWISRNTMSLSRSSLETVIIAIWSNQSLRKDFGLMSQRIGKRLISCGRSWNRRQFTRNNWIKGSKYTNPSKVRTKS